MFWDPYKKLWNEELFDFFNKWMPSFFAKKAKKGVIFIDSLLLGVRVYIRSVLSKKRFSSLEQLKDVRVNYFDIGVHKEAAELEFVINKLFKPYGLDYHAYAFEAIPDFVDEASKHFSNTNRVKFYNLALCKDVPKNGVVKIYLASNDGLGNSFYKGQLEEEFVEVSANKFSDFLKEEKIELSNAINIIRLNVEGAEYDVLKDLIENDLHSKFNGFYGMWDDVKKIGGEEEKSFRRLLKENSVSNLSFNGRDMKREIRRGFILKDLKTALMKGPNNHV